MSFTEKSAMKNFCALKVVFYYETGSCIAKNKGF